MKGLHLSTIESGESHDIALPEELRTHLRGVTWFPDGEKLIIEAHSESEFTRVSYLSSRKPSKRLPSCSEPTDLGVIAWR
jgi:hypothetical protein